MLTRGIAPNVGETRYAIDDDHLSHFRRLDDPDDHGT